MRRGCDDRLGEMTTIAAEMGQGLAEISRLRTRPIGFLWHYVCRHPWGHSIVFGSVLVAVVCAVMPYALVRGPITLVARLLYRKVRHARSGE